MGIDAKTIYEGVTTALGPKAPSYRTVVRWASRSHEGREDVNDDGQSARLVTKLTDESIELVRQIINNDSPHFTYDKIIAETSLSWCNRTNYSRLSEDKKKNISLGTSSIER